MKNDMDQRVALLQLINSENSFRHHGYSKEMLQYEYIRNGDMRAIEEAERMIHSDDMGHLSDDPVKNLLYLCICNITLVTRFAIEGGMEPEKAYNASDLYIQRYDKAHSKEEIYALHREMIRYFAESVASAKKREIMSKPVSDCIKYISGHLHERITCTELAGTVGLNSSYLSVLFKREVGMNITEYVMMRRVEAAESLLKQTDYSLNEISDFLSFSNYSHFARTFRKFRGESPREYRKRCYGHARLK